MRIRCVSVETKVVKRGEDLFPGAVEVGSEALI